MQYRALHPKETVSAGDQYLGLANEWRAIDCPGGTAYDNLTYRRPARTTGAPAGYRWVDHTESWIEGTTKWRTHHGFQATDEDTWNHNHDVASPPFGFEHYQSRASVPFGYCVPLVGVPAVPAPAAPASDLAALQTRHDALCAQLADCIVLRPLADDDTVQESDHITTRYMSPGAVTPVGPHHFDRTVQERRDTLGSPDLKFYRKV